MTQSIRKKIKNINKALALLLLSVTILGNAACGIKPKTVDSPSGAGNDTYPRSYPSAQ